MKIALDVLDSETTALLRDRLEDAGPDHFGDEESWREWEPTFAEMREVLDSGRLSVLRRCPLARKELNALVEHDEYRLASGRPNAAGRLVLADLCRAGEFEVYDPHAYRSARPRTIVVDGIRYEAD